MNILAIIPARSGSKGIKNKNIMLFNGKPLIASTIESAKRSKVFTKILVSTDSAEYSRIAKKYGASINSLRSKELSDDKSSMIEVILNVLDEEKSIGNHYDLFILLQPTSPLRSSEDIIQALQIYITKHADFVVSVSKFDKNPNVFGTLDGISMKSFQSNNLFNARRQDANLYYINGAIYIANVRKFIKTKSFYTEFTFAYIMPKNRAVDIDTIDDLLYAEYLLSKQ